MTEAEMLLVQKCAKALGWHMTSPERRTNGRDEQCYEWRIGFDWWIRGRWRTDGCHEACLQDIFGLAKHMMGQIDPQLEEALKTVVKDALEHRLKDVIEVADAAPDPR